MINLGDEQKAMEHELHNLRQQLEKSHEMVKHLQDREKQCLAKYVFNYFYFYAPTLTGWH